MSAPPADAPEVFISYKSEDRDRVLGIVDRLREDGRTCWVDAEFILGGQHYFSLIPPAIQNSRAVLLMCTHGLMAAWTQIVREVQLADKYGRPVVMLMLDTGIVVPQEIEYLLIGRQWIATAGLGEVGWWSKLLDALDVHGVSRAAPVPRPTRAPVRPPAPAPPSAPGDSAPAPAATTPAPTPPPLVSSREQARELQTALAARAGGETAWTNDLGVRFKLIPPGRFQMGAAPGDPVAQPNEQPRQVVRVERPFWAATFPLTNAVLRELLSSDDPAAAALRRDPGFARKLRKGDGDDDAPATELSARDAAGVCQWLRNRDGKAYRLPTEAEWEYAARAGAGGRVWWEDHIAPDKAAVFAAKGPAPASERRANGWGLIDVLGNVAEWTASEYATSLVAEKALQSFDPLRDGARCVRGGSWRDPLMALRLSRRVSMGAGTRADVVGLRLVCDIIHD